MIQILQEPSDPIVLKRHPGVKLYNEGMLALTQHQYAKAIKILQSFAKQFPEDFDTDNAYWMGYAYFELGDFKNAKKSLKVVLRKYEHRPTSQGYKTPDTIYLLGKIALQDNQPAQAKFYYQKVIELFPTSASARKAEGDLGLLNTKNGLPSRLDRNSNSFLIKKDLNNQLDDPPPLILLQTFFYATQYTHCCFSSILS